MRDFNGPMSCSIRRGHLGYTLQCPVSPKSDIGRRFMSTQPLSPVTGDVRRNGWHKVWISWNGMEGAGVAVEWSGAGVEWIRS